jgi:hypothetical protein
MVFPRDGQSARILACISIYANLDPDPVSLQKKDTSRPKQNRFELLRWLRVTDERR